MLNPFESLARQVVARGINCPLPVTTGDVVPGGMALSVSPPNETVGLRLTTQRRAHVAG